MEYTPKFQDGEKVLLDGEVVTVRQWAYAPNLKRYTYSIVECPGTFFFENELKKFEVISDGRARARTTTV